MDRLLESGFARLYALTVPQRRIVQVAADVLLLTLVFVAAVVLRTESFAPLLQPGPWLVMAVTLPVAIAACAWLGQYRDVLRYMGTHALVRVLQVAAISGLVLGLAGVFLWPAMPAAVPVLFSILTAFVIGGLRFVLRAIYQSGQTRQKRRVVIYGAGTTGQATAVRLMQGNDYAPVAFVDDNGALHGTRVQGLVVYAPQQLARLQRDYSVDAVMLAIPSAGREQRRDILATLESLPMKVMSVPHGVDRAPQQGHAPENAIRPLSVEDLLGRDPVPAQPELMRAKIVERSVMITGAGGSIGSELARQIFALRPRRLILLDASEFALYTIDRELAEMASEGAENTVEIVPVLGSVRNGARIERLMRTHHIETVFHAAAFKHVPLIEQNAIEGIDNNVFGTLEVARAAIATGVRDFTLVSSDKAVRPGSLMGASKRLSELICIAIGNGPGRTRFSVVRFGNVLGSSGSVIPAFQAQIAAGGPVKVTHPDVTRYFMTLTEAAELVIQSCALARGNCDIFVLDMGKPVRIADLARRMVRLSGRVPIEVGEGAAVPSLAPGQTAVVYTKLRPGEKLFEELMIGPLARATVHSRIMTADERGIDWAGLSPILETLREACAADDIAAVRSVLRGGYIGYRPDAHVLESAAETDTAPEKTTTLHLGEALIDSGHLAAYRTPLAGRAAGS